MTAFDTGKLLGFRLVGANRGTATLGLKAGVKSGVVTGLKRGTKTGRHCAQAVSPPDATRFPAGA